jgi:hypothetical protein
MKRVIFPRSLARLHFKLCSLLPAPASCLVSVVQTSSLVFIIIRVLLYIVSCGVVTREHLNG